MSNQYLSQAVLKAVNHIYNLGDIDISVTPPTKSDAGDYTTNIAFRLSKLIGDKPQNIAEKVAIVIKDFAPEIQDVYAVNGHLNFVLTQKFKHQCLVQLHDLDSPSSNECLLNQNIVLEFVSANPTGPLSVVNGRAGVLGDVLAKLYQKSGASVITRYYVNDNPDSGQIIALKNTFKYYDDVQHNTNVLFPEDGYKGKFIKNAWEHYNKMRNQSSDENEAFFKYGVGKLSFSQIQDLNAMGINYTSVDRESHIITQYSIQDIFQSCGKDIKDYTFIEDGALVLNTSAYGDDKNRVIIRSDGRPTYYHNDIIYHVYKYRNAPNARVINIWGTDHHGYIARMNAAMRILGFNDIEVILTQMVNLEIEEDGITKTFVGSKREGQYLLLKDDFVSKVGIDSARWYFLMDSPANHTTINVKKAAEQNMSNPVFYIQYAHARFCNIIKKSDAMGISLNSRTPNLYTLTSDIANELILKLEQYNNVCIRAASQSNIQIFKQYLYELAQLMHKFYEKERLINQDVDYWLDGLYLVETVNSILKDGLELLGINAPESMFVEEA